MSEPNEDDPFKTELGMGPDLYDYRDSYLPFVSAAVRAHSSGADRDNALDRNTEAAVIEAAKRIRSADFLLVGAGAGMGVDSGLATYADVAAVPVSSHELNFFVSLQRQREPNSPAYHP